MFVQPLLPSGAYTSRMTRSYLVKARKRTLFATSRHIALWLWPLATFLSTLIYPHPLPVTTRHNTTYGTQSLPAHTLLCPSRLSDELLNHRFYAFLLSYLIEILQQAPSHAGTSSSNSSSCDRLLLLFVLFFHSPPSRTSSQELVHTKCILSNHLPSPPHTLGSVTNLCDDSL